MTFLQKLESLIQKNNSLLCIGLDTDFEKLPAIVKQSHNPVYAFNKEIIDRTADLACCYKLQVAYYSSLGISGIEMLEQTIHYLTNNYPDIPLILDAKRGDIGDTSEKYVQEVFETFEVDAVTVNPYLGKDSLLPFLKRRDKGIIVLCRTSNKGAADFQDLLVSSSSEEQSDESRSGDDNSSRQARTINSEPLYLKVAEEVQKWHEEFSNCLLVVGATWPEEIKKIRDVAKEMFFLVPGIGAQGGDLEGTLKNGLREDKSGLIIHSSRSILYSSSFANFAEEARMKATILRNQINHYRK